MGFLYREFTLSSNLLLIACPPATFSVQGTLFWTSVVTVLAELHNNLVCVLKVGKPFDTSEIFCVCNTVDDSVFDSMRLHGCEVGTEHLAIRQTPV